MMIIYPRELAIKLSADPAEVRRIVDEELQMNEQMQQKFVDVFQDVTLRIAVDSDGSFTVRYWMFNLVT